MTSIESKEDKIEYYHTEDRCCFWWQITRGPHINTVYHYCVQSQGESCLLVGRQKKCWIRLKKDLEVSGKHAEFEFLADCSSFTLKDLKSTNGTRLNGLVLEPQRSYLLHPHDLILIGKTTLRFLKGQKMCVMKKDDTCSQEQRSDNINLNAPDDGPVDHFVSNKENLAIQPTRNCNGDSIEKKALSIDVAQQKTSSKSGGEQYKDFHPDEMIGKLFCPTIQKADIDCFVCHKDLSTMDILHRQMHLNACLDGVKPPFSTTTNTATTKKRNRVTDSCKNTVENEQLNLALALSKSLVEPHEQIAMEIQFVSSQMAEIDMQVMKLINQKKKMQAKYRKLQKKYTRIKPTQVLCADQIQMEVNKMLNFLFPPRQKKEIVVKVCNKTTRHLKSRLIRWKKKNSCEKVSMLSGHMWTLASQMEANPTMYLTRLFLRYLTCEQNVHVDTCSDTEVVQPLNDDKEVADTN